MRKIKKFEEIEAIKNMIIENKFSLKMAIEDAERMNGDKINNLEFNEELENILENNFIGINIYSIAKDASRNDYKNRKDYLIEADVQVMNDNNFEVYRIKNWFSSVKNKNEIIFDDLELISNMIEEGEI